MSKKNNFNSEFKLKTRTNICHRKNVCNFVWRALKDSAYKREPTT